MYLVELVFGVSFCSGLFIFCSMRKHMLVTLLGLKFLVLSVYLFMVLLICSVGASMYFIFVFLVFSVCEACLGMSILVFMIRSTISGTIMNMLLQFDLDY